MRWQNIALSTALALSACATTPTLPSRTNSLPNEARLFQNDPNRVTIVDLAAVFVLFRNLNASPSEILAGINQLLNTNLSRLDPSPTLANTAFVAPAERLYLLDVA